MASEVDPGSAGPDDHATQHVFLQLLRHKERFDANPSEAIAWMQRVATNVSLSRVREGRRRSTKLEVLHHDALPARSPRKEALRDRDAARHVLDHVESPSRELAPSVLAGEESHEEATAHLGVSSKTVQRARTPR